MLNRPRLQFPHPHTGLPHLLHVPMALAAALAAMLTLVGLVASGNPLSLLIEPSLGPSLSEITAKVRTYASEWQPLLDPLITLDNGIQVKSSSMRGVEIDGVTYYYRLLHSFSYDPLSRGDVTEVVPVATLDPGTDWEVQVYRLK